MRFWTSPSGWAVHASSPTAAKALCGRPIAVTWVEVDRNAWQNAGKLDTCHRCRLAVERIHEHVCKCGHHGNLHYLHVDRYRHEGCAGCPCVSFKTDGESS